jgi:predicted DNA repair protein MutK
MDTRSGSSTTASFDRVQGLTHLFPDLWELENGSGVRSLPCCAMSAGLAALLDDVAALARVAAASVDDVAAGASRASVKAAGVIVDDAAVTPRYVQGFRPERELPMIRRIAAGSLRNKIVFILPLALLLSEFVDWLLTPILMVGGAYLCYEGAEKVWELIRPHDKHAASDGAAQEPPDEDTLVRGAIRTDFILSAEIMVISLNEVADEPLVSRAVILVLVAIAITALVYGAVALIVKMDDVGLGLAESRTGAAASFGRGLVRAMPVVLSVLAKVGLAAMLWVGGHILLVGLDELGASALYDTVHHAEEDVHDELGAAGGVGAWLTNTGASAVLGLVIGAILVALAHLRGRRPVH